MATKTKPVMDIPEVEAKASGRPTRNVKPVSYKEHTGGKRSPTYGEKSEPKVKKDKKDEPTKKAGKKKAADPVDEPNKQDVGGGGGDDDEPMRDVQSDVPKSAADKSKKTQSRNKNKMDEASDYVEVGDSADKKTEKGGKAPIRRKGTVAQTNGEGSSKSEAVASKSGKVKRAATEVKNGDDNQGDEPVASKPVASKTAKAKKGAETEGAGDSQDKPVASKAGAAKNSRAKKPAEKEEPNVAKGESDGQDEAPVTSAPTKPAATKNSRSKNPKKEEPNVAKGESDGQDEAPVTSAPTKPAATKNSRSKNPKKEEPNGAKGDSDSQDEAPVTSAPTKPVASKSARGKDAEKEESNGAKAKSDAVKSSKSAKATKGKHVVKESDAVDANEVTETATMTTKGRKKVGAAEDKPTTLRGTKRKATEPVQNNLPKAKLTKASSTTQEVQSSADDRQLPGAEWNTKITTWNVAGLRAAVKKDAVEYLKSDNSDIICLQETKCTEDQVPPEIDEIKGYHKYWRGEKGGHAGVSLFTKVMPYDVKFGFDDREADEEARLITAEYTKFYLVCVYVPNAGRKLVNLQKRLNWDLKFHEYVKALNAKKPVIICGDMNVAHGEIDLANPKTNKKSAGFTLEERNSFSDLLNKGFVDTYRQLYPDKTKAYTFWTYLANARAKNVGWRLDYFLVSEKLMTNVVDNMIRSTILGSDHCPVTLFLKL